MSVEWEPPGNEVPGSPQSFGRQLRGRLGGAYAGLDAGMIALLERLFEIPGVTGKDEPGSPPE